MEGGEEEPKQKDKKRNPKPLMKSTYQKRGPKGGMDLNSKLCFLPYPNKFGATELVFKGIFMIVRFQNSREQTCFRLSHSISGFPKPWQFPLKQKK